MACIVLEYLHLTGIPASKGILGILGKEEKLADFGLPTTPSAQAACLDRVQSPAWHARCRINKRSGKQRFRILRGCRLGCTFGVKGACFALGTVKVAMLYCV
jgi:hypothetical protein